MVARFAMASLPRLWVAVVCLVGTGGCADDRSPVLLESFELRAGGEIWPDVELGEVESRFGEARGPSASTPSEYRLRTQVTLPPSFSRDHLTLTLPVFQGRAEVVANGVRRRSIYPDPLARYAPTEPLVFDLSGLASADGVLDLEVIVQHEWQKSAWWPYAPRLSNTRYGDRATLAVVQLNRWLAGAALGTLFTIIFTYFWLFLSDRRNRTPLWFCGQATLAAYYPAYCLGVTQWTGPAWDVPVLASTMVAAVTVSVPAARAQFGKPMPRWTWIVPPAAFLSAVALLRDPHTSALPLGLAAVATLTIMFSLQLLFSVRVLRDDPEAEGVVPNLAGWLFLAVVATPDFVPWAGLGEPALGIRLGGLGLTVYTLLQFVALVRSHLRSLRRSEAREREVQRLNAELRRQMGDRARQLAESLASLVRGGGEYEALGEAQVLNGRYRVRQAVGRGAMGAVYAAERIEDDHLFAVKMVTKANDARVLSRFAREAQIASTVKHGNVIGIHDIDVAETGFMYIVLEFADGPRLRAVKEHFRSPELVLPLLSHIAEGLSAIHDKGIVHRDLKPDNVLLVSHRKARYVAKIADFGISGLLTSGEAARAPSVSTERVVLNMPKLETSMGLAASQGDRPTAASIAVESSIARDTSVANPQHAKPVAARQSESPSETKGGLSTGDLRTGSVKTGITAHTSTYLTHEGAVMGTPAYMAPEVADKGATGEPSADLFSFGIMAFELVSGAPPKEIRARALSGDRAWLRDAAHELPTAVANVLRACLSASGELRPSIDEVREVLAPHAGPHIELPFSTFSGAAAMPSSEVDDPTETAD